MKKQRLTFIIAHSVLYPVSRASFNLLRDERREGLHDHYSFPSKWFPVPLNRFVPTQSMHDLYENPDKKSIWKRIDNIQLIHVTFKKLPQPLPIVLKKIRKVTTEQIKGFDFLKKIYFKSSLYFHKNFCSVTG